VEQWSRPRLVETPVPAEVFNHYIIIYYTIILTFFSTKNIDRERFALILAVERRGSAGSPLEICTRGSIIALNPLILLDPVFCDIFDVNNINGLQHLAEALSRLFGTKRGKNGRKRF
jgi:hypothetical protein